MTLKNNIRMEISKKFWIFCILYLGSEVNAKIRGIAGVDYPNYSTIPNTSFKCSEQQFNPGFYADVETGCQVFHYCHNHRKESFLCPPGTIYNQPIRSCDYWYSSECDLAPSFYYMNTLNKDKIETDIQTFNSVENPPNNIFEKMAALYNSEGNVEDSQDELLMSSEEGDDYNNISNEETHTPDSTQTQEYDEIVFTNAPFNEQVNSVNQKDINDLEFTHREKSIINDLSLNKEEYEKGSLEYLLFGGSVDYSKHENFENALSKTEDYEYKVDDEGKISPEVTGKINLSQEYLSDDKTFNYIEKSEIGLSKRFSETEPSLKINRLRRRPKYEVLQSKEISSLESHNNLNNISSSENIFKSDLNKSSVVYTDVPFKYSNSHETDENVVRNPRGKLKRKRKSITLLPDNMDEISTSAILSDTPQLSKPSHTYFSNDETVKSLSKGESNIIQEEIVPLTTIPLEVSSINPINLVGIDHLEGTSEIYDFLLPSEVSETATISALNEVSTLEAEMKNELNQDSFHKEIFPGELFGEIEKNTVSMSPQGIIEQKFPQDFLDSIDTETIDLREDFKNKHVASTSLPELELSNNYLENVKDYESSEFQDSSTFPADLETHTFIENEYLEYDSNENFEEKWIVATSDNSISKKETEAYDQAGNFPLELQTNSADYAVPDYGEHDDISNIDKVTVSTLNPLEYMEESENEEQDLSDSHEYEWMDETEFLSLLEMNGIALNESTNNVYYMLDENGGMKQIVYDNSELKDLSNLNVEKMPYDNEEYITVSSQSFHMKEYVDENLEVLENSEMNGDATLNISSDTKSEEFSEEFTPQNIISESVTLSVPVNLNPIKISQTLQEASSDIAISQTSEDTIDEELLSETKDNLVGAEGNESTEELDNEDFIDHSSSQDTISNTEGTLVENTLNSNSENDTISKEMSELISHKKISSSPETENKQELKVMPQIQPIFQEKDPQENMEMEESPVINKSEFLLNAQPTSTNTKASVLQDLRKPELPSTKVSNTNQIDLPKVQHSSSDVKIPTTGKNAPKSQFPSRSKSYLTKTAGKSQFTNMPALRNMQMLLSKYLSNTGVDDRSLFSSRTGKLFKSEKLSKLIHFGRKLLETKMARFNNFRKYVESFNREMK